MCEPTTILLATSAAVGAMGQLYAGDATANAAEHQAKVQTINAQTEEYRARDAIVRGNEEQRKHRERAAQLQGRQRAAQAANGIDVTFGSALDLAVDTAGQVELDALTIRSNSYRQAYDHQTGAANQRAGAAGARAGARAARTGSYIKAGGTLLTGASNAYGAYQSNTGNF